MKIRKWLSSFLASVLILSNAAVLAEVSETKPVNPAESGDNVTEEPAIVPNFTMPNNIRATIITPTVDFLKEERMTVSDVENELDTLYSTLSAIGLNAVYINTTYEGTAFFSTDMNDTSETDYMSIAIDKAYEHDFRVYMIFDLDYILAQKEENTDVLDSLISNSHRFVLKYRCDGIVIDNYYSVKDSDSYAGYMLKGSGIGYDNWLYDSNELYFSAVSEVVHITDNTVPVGIMIRDMWANSDTNQEGSDTKDEVQAFYDGYSDTKKFLSAGYADFCVVNAYGSLTSSTLPFEKVTGWWSDLAKETGTTMYIVHFNERQGGDGEGWGGVDQILQQLTLSKDLSAFGGSVFHSCDNLLTNTSLTTNITKFYGDQINLASLFEELEMTSPKKLNFTTEEPYVDFMGKFDENFDVFFNGKKIVLNEAGNFYFEEPLKIGKNTFTIEHKGKVYTYKIERKITTLKSLDDSIADGKSLSVEGETKLEIACLAYKGATVTATLNGKTITLNESEGQQDSDINSSYTIFKGTYTVPAGIISKEQNLGNIKVTASYAGYTQSLFGASVKVLALPEPPKDINSSLGDQNSAGSGEVVGTMDAVHTESESVQYVRVNNDYTTVYDGATAGSIPTPNNAQLPKGTLDYIYASSGDYYITETGKRFLKVDVTTFSDTGLGKNALLVKKSGTNNGSSYFTIGLDHKTSFNIDFAGLSYYSGGDGSYNLNSFNATHVYITFDNITSVTKLPSFENNYVFSAGKWDQVTVKGIPKFRMVLTLRQPGVYAGCGASYNSDGDLVLSFGVTTNNLSGMTIVIDPGHGYCDKEDAYGRGLGNFVFDVGAVGFIREYDANLAISKELESQLKALGANVVRIKTESAQVNTRQRPNYGRKYGCDMYISIHANKIVGNPSVRGTEVYYYTPYSQPLAAAVSQQIAGYFSSSVYSDGANKNRGAKYSYYKVTLQQDFPSILVETGFVSNEEDAYALNNPTHQKNIAASIIKGIKSYIGKSNINYSSNGSDTVSTFPEPEPEETTTTEITTTTTIENTTARETSATTQTTPETTPAETTEATTTEEQTTAEPTTEAPVTNNTTVPEETVAQDNPTTAALDTPDPVEP